MSAEAMHRAAGGAMHRAAGEAMRRAAVALKAALKPGTPPSPAARPSHCRHRAPRLSRQPA